MKNILPLLAGILTTLTVSAQITLNAGSYPSFVFGTDSLKMTTAASAFPSLTPTADGIWDMSIVTDTAPNYFAYRVPTIIYQFADSNYYNFSGYSYQGNVQSSITGTGILEYGVEIQQAVYDLFPLTGSHSDSIFILSQNMVYSTSHSKVAFPTMFHTSWLSTYSSEFNFQLSLSIGPLTYNHSPGIVRTYFTENDSVVGWGKMRIKDASGSPSAYLNVLQVQTTTNTIDSFFINGNPFPGLLFTVLSLTQGQKTTTYQQNYYRAQEVTPLAQVAFTDSTYTQPKSAATHVQRLAPSAVANVLNETGVSVFPNPVTNGIVSLELPATGSAWAYELTDINGKKITDGALQTKDKIAKFLLPASIAPGIYYLRIINDNTQVSIAPIEVAR